jgi:hypothetical protein
VREVTRAARATWPASGQDRAGWGNALEKADEELKVEAFADVHVDEEGTILGLLYPPHERIGVTYYVQTDRCQCEAFAAPSDPADPHSPPQKRPCRHRAKLRLIERVAQKSGARPARTEAREQAIGQISAALSFPVPPLIRPPQSANVRRSRRSRKPVT